MRNWPFFHPQQRNFFGGFIGTAFLFLIAVFSGCGGVTTPSNGGTQGSAPSGLSYAASSIVATVGQAISSDVPSVLGTVSLYSISPSLPSGLTINSNTGVISGTPTVVAAKLSYVITAANGFGQTTATIQITVNSASTPPANTFSESFSTGTAACWSGGPSSCIQAWADANGAAATQTIVSAPSSGWSHPRVLKIPGSSAPTLYTMGTIPYASSGTMKGDATVEFSYDSTGFSPSGGIFVLNANTDGSPFYQLGLDGGGNCVLGGGASAPCAPNQVHRLHVHFDGASSYDQIDGTSQHAFTADAVNPFSEVTLAGNSGTNLYFGDIAIGLTGYNSCLAPPQVLLEALGSGSVSAGELNAGTHGGNSPDGWILQPVSNLSFSFVSGGSSFSTPSTVCGTSYSGNGGEVVRMTMPVSSGAGGYWEIGHLTTSIGYSVGFAWSYTSTGLNDVVDLFGIGDDFGTISNLQLNIVNNAQRICFENDVNTSLGSPCIPVDVSPSTPYWITFGTSATGDDTAYLYTYPGKVLLGSAHITPNARPAQVGTAVFKLGKTGSEPIDHDMTMDYWNVMMDITGGKVPLLPK